MQGSILVVEDSDTLRYLIRLVLEETGYEVVEAVDGEDALERVRKSHVRLVMTDMEMPRMNGLEFVRRLRELPGHRETPVIAVSAEAERYARHLGQDLDAQGWIDKPFSVDDILQTIADLLEADETRPRAGEDRNTIPGPPPRQRGGVPGPLGDGSCFSVGGRES